MGPAADSSSDIALIVAVMGMVALILAWVVSQVRDPTPHEPHGPGSDAHQVERAISDSSPAPLEQWPAPSPQQAVTPGPLLEGPPEAHRVMCGYEITAVLGDGGMGTVYRGVDPRFNRPVALKVLHAHFQRDAGVVERFKVEAVVQARLQHPHIVSVLDFVDGPEGLALVMELVPGEPLSTIIGRAAGPLPLAWCRLVVGQLLSAMAHAHAQGLVHRDIKPSNVLVCEFDGAPHAKITDFGIAKVLGSDKLRTATGAKMGTLVYMSPEHLLSPKYVDHRADIYALGALLYEAITGAPPFEADTEYGLMEQIVRKEPPRPSRRVARLPVQWDFVVGRAMAKDPAQRFGSCREMGAALSGIPVG